MEPHPGLGGNGAFDGVSYQQTVQMQEYKYMEHMKKLNEKWAAMKTELEKANKGIIHNDFRFGDF